MRVQTLGECTKSALWVGLDGVGSNEVVQVGTSQDVIDGYMSDGSLLAITSDYGWTEWFPAAMQQIPSSNFVVNPGDRIFAEVWVSPWCPDIYPFGVPRPHPLYCPLMGHFFIENLTTHVAPGLNPAPVPDGRTFSGTSAEWIMERPSPNNPDGSCCTGYYDLSNYNVAGMWGASYQLATGEWVPYDRDLIVQITMFSTDWTRKLSSAERVPIIDPYSKAAAQSLIKFTWHDFK
jgi:hypothetical protein